MSREFQISAIAYLIIAIISVLAGIFGGIYVFGSSSGVTAEKIMQLEKSDDQQATRISVIEANIVTIRESLIRIETRLGTLPKVN